MYLGEPFEHVRSASREPQTHDTAVVGVVDAPDEPGFFGAVDELHRAVMTQQQRVGDVTHRRAAIAAVATHRQQQLVLRGGDPRTDGLRLAPVQELAQRSPELEEALVVAVS